MAPLPGSVPGTANLTGTGTFSADTTTTQKAADLPSARGNRQVRRGAGLFWVAVALVLLGGVAVGFLAGNWSMATTRGAMLAGICIAAFTGAGFCTKTAIKRLLPKV
jgi:hypothetical protein